MATTGYLKDAEGNRFYPATHAAYTYTDWGTDVQSELSLLKNKDEIWVGTRNQWDAHSHSLFNCNTVVFIYGEGTYIYQKNGDRLIKISDSRSAAAQIAYYEDTKDPENAWKTISKNTASNGQILIVKASSDEIQGYVWSSKYSKWYVFSGNVDADHVMFTEDILCAGDYTKVGNINKTQNGTTTIPAKDKSLSEVMRTIFTKELQPSITSAPSVTLNFPQAGAYEVGTIVEPTYSAILNPGSYTYGPDTNVEATSWEVTDTDGNSNPSNLGIFTSFVVGDETNYKITATATHNAGNYANTNLGNATTTRIESGTKSKVSSSITGYRACFYGSKLIPVVLNSNNIRNLSSGNSKSFSMDIVEGASQVIIAYPGNVTLKKVEDTGAFNQDIKEVFVKHIIPISGANGYTGKDYSVFVYTPSVLLGKSKYNVQIN